MEMVLLTALGVGGATVIGALLGFLFKNPSHKFSDMILSILLPVYNYCIIIVILNFWDILIDIHYKIYN